MRNYNHPERSRLNILRSQLVRVKLIFIDKISIVGNTTLIVQINNRLKGIKGSSLPFCGVHIIAIGDLDLFQLQPIMDGYVFKDINNSDNGVLAPNLWQEHFNMFELHEIMR